MDINKDSMTLDEAIAVINEIDPNCEITSSYNAERTVLNAVKNGEMVKCKHGKLYEDDETYCGSQRSNYKCSVCGEINGSWRCALKPNQLPNYCMWCGAKMDGKEQNDD